MGGGGLRRAEWHPMSVTNASGVPAGGKAIHPPYIMALVVYTRPGETLQPCRINPFSPEHCTLDIATKDVSAYAAVAPYYSMTGDN